MMIRRAALLSLVSVAGLSLLGCASTETKAPAANMGAMNSTCPYSGRAVNKDVTSTYGGKTVGFCCNGCKGTFDAASDADKAAKMKSASAAK